MSMQPVLLFLDRKDPSAKLQDNIVNKLLIQNALTTISPHKLTYHIANLTGFRNVP